MFQNLHIGIADFLMTITVLLLSISFHEWAHAVTADAMGDPLPRSQGRVTLWPPAHWDPIGTVMMVFTVIAGFGLGWGKPVQSNPSAYTKFSRRISGFLVVGAGPLSNLFIATVLSQIMRLNIVHDPFYKTWLEIAVDINIGLCLFNLLPVAPARWLKIIGLFAPTRYGRFFSAVFRKGGTDPASDSRDDARFSARPDSRPGT